MDQNTVAAGEAEFDPARERTTLVNALADAARAALDFDFMSAAVLGAIPGTEPQQYVIAGTPDGISKMLQAIASPSPVSEAQAERRKLRDEALAAIRHLAECEHEDAQNRGKGGPGVFPKVERAQSLVVVAIDALAAPTAKEAEQASAQAAEVRDAARYRWLRNESALVHGDVPTVFRADYPTDPDWNRMLNGDDMDKAIDAAIRAVGTGEQA